MLIPACVITKEGHRGPGRPNDLVTFSAVYLIAFMKGAFGGGFAIIGIPLCQWSWIL